MPVEKFRSIDDMNRAALRKRNADFAQFLRHCAQFRGLSPKRYPRGVYRFRGVEDAERGRELTRQG